MHRCLIVLSLAVLILVPVRATAQVAVYDPANHIQNILQAVRALTQITKEAEQIDMMVRNLESVGEFSWRDLVGYSEYLADLSRQRGALSYADDGIYGTYREYFFGALPFNEEVLEILTYGDAYKLWSAAVLDTLAATLATANAQHQDYLPSLDHLAALKAQAQAADGNLQALEVNAMLSAHLAEEITKLNQVLAASLNAQNVAGGYEMTRRSNAEATARYMAEQAELPFVPYDGLGGQTGIPAAWPFPCAGCAN